MARKKQEAENKRIAAISEVKSKIDALIESLKKNGVEVLVEK